MKMRKALTQAMVSLAMFCALGPMLRAQAASRFDGNWTTSMSCEAHGQMPAYSWDFPSTIKDGNFHGMHSQPDTAGYLEINGMIGDNGASNMKAKGWVSESKASGVFALKGNNYDYVIRAKFDENSGSGTRDKGVGILGRTCTFQFTKQTDANVTPTGDATPPSQ